MKTRDRWIAAAVAVPGIAACIFSFARFFGTMSHNGLAGARRPFFQEHYLAIGNAYSQAFAVGFFFSLFLVLLAVAIGARTRRRPGVAVETAGK